MKQVKHLSAFSLAAQRPKDKKRAPCVHKAHWTMEPLLLRQRRVHHVDLSGNEIGVSRREGHSGNKEHEDHWHSVPA